jgi:hypothetical protein
MRVAPRSAESSTRPAIAGRTAVTGIAIIGIDGSSRPAPPGVVGRAKRFASDRCPWHSSNVHIRIIVLRYPTRAYQSDTTVVSNDRQRPHQASQNESRPGNLSGRLSPVLLTKPPPYQVLKLRVQSRRSELRRCLVSHFVSTPVCLTVVSIFCGTRSAVFASPSVRSGRPHLTPSHSSR